jgi:DNA-binding LytR/AlgR family response regulator
MRAVIIEDEDIASRRLKSLIHEMLPECEIMAQLDSVVSATSWFTSNEMPDLLFLDIQLNDGYGFDILDNLPEHPPVIFTTAYNEYAIRGFKYNGLDYLLKPIDKAELAKALEKFNKSVKIPDTNKIEALKSLLKKEFKKRFIVKKGNQYKSFSIENISYFMAEDGLIFLVTKDNMRSPIEYSLDQLEEILDPILFFRINRKYMVSVESVSEIHSYFNSRLLLKLNPSQEEQVIVSRERTSKFKNWLDL